MKNLNSELIGRLRQVCVADERRRLQIFDLLQSATLDLVIARRTSRASGGDVECAQRWIRSAENKALEAMVWLRTGAWPDEMTKAVGVQVLQEVGVDTSAWNSDRPSEQIPDSRGINRDIRRSVQMLKMVRDATLEYLA